MVSDLINISNSLNLSYKTGLNKSGLFSPGYECVVGFGGYICLHELKLNWWIVSDGNKERDENKMVLSAYLINNTYKNPFLLPLLKISLLLLLLLLLL